MLVVCEPDRQQGTGSELQQTLVKLLGHKIEPTDKNNIQSKVDALKKETSSRSAPGGLKVSSTDFG